MTRQHNSTIDRQRFPNDVLTLDRQEHIYQAYQNVNRIIERLIATGLTPRQQQLIREIRKERLQLLAAVVLPDESLMEEKEAVMVV